MKPKRLRLLSHIFELAVSLTWFLVGLTYLRDPQLAAIASPIGRYVGAWQYAWAVLYMLSGPGIWYGVFRHKAWHEVWGLVVLGTGLVMQGFAAVTYHFDPRAINYFIFAGASMTRAGYLFKHHG